MIEHSFPEVVVVEGEHDIQRLRSLYPDIDCVKTNGTEISEETLMLLEKLATTRGLILFFDPDYPGRQITKRILDRIPKCQVAFLPAHKARSRNLKKVGVEHADDETIRHSLEHLFTVHRQGPDRITRLDLQKRKFVDADKAVEKRTRLAKRLGLPPSNGKTLLRYLNLFQIDPQVLDEEDL